MATLPNGASGYQVGDGNLGEISFYNTSAPVALTGASVTITAENLAAGVCTMDSGGTDAGTYVFPTGALLDAAFSSLKVGSTFDCSFINIGDNAANDVTFTAGTGNTLVGNDVIQDPLTKTSNTSGTFRFRKTGDAAYSIYRVS
jgi:hypothetical protein